ncbi:MAG: ABC transporter permease [Ignavibacteriales bacterium]|nr:MAG: ABC transporter permease [Ignavibacteriales bacterium]
MFNRIYAIAKKEVRQLSRDIRMLLLLFIFPLVLLVIFGYAVNFDVKHVQLAVYDRDKSSLSRDFVNMLASSEYFDLITHIENDSEIKELLDNQKVQCVLVIPEDLSQKFYSKQEAKVQVLIDGVNANSATIIRNYFNLATMNFSSKLSSDYLAVTGKASYLPIDFRPIFWFNPELKSTIFLIPGLIAMILIITGVVSITLSIVKEKELGTIEQINVSPLSALELIIGKTAPNIVISFIVAVIILAGGYFLFDITIKGSIILLAVTTLLYIIASLSMGILVSTIAESQQVAFQAASLISMLPSMLLSGFIFPIESMPVVIQVLTNITPAKFFMVILRDILIKGVGLEAFYMQVIYLLIFSLVLLAIATVRYKKSANA